MSRKEVDKPWWKTQLPWLTERLERFAERRGAHGEAGDLTQDVLEALTAALSQRQGVLHGEWLASERPADEDAQRAILWAFARTILRRRIADQFRRSAKRWRYKPTEGVNPEDLAATNALPDDVLMRRELVAVCVQAMAALPAADLQVLRLWLDDFDSERAMSPAERQRLFRARKRLLDRLGSRLRGT